jgi:hypothetical protein
MECCSYAGLKLLKDSVVIRQNRGSIWANGFYARKTAPTSVLYTFANDDSRIRWSEDCILSNFGGIPKGVQKEKTEDWAKAAWKKLTPHAANAAHLVLAACDRWETICEAEAMETGRAAWDILSTQSVIKVATDPFAVAAVWRFCRSTLSRPGIERTKSESILAEAAAAAVKIPGLDDFRLAVIYSAAFDVTGEARWCDQKKRFGDAAVMRAEKLVDRILARNQAASGEEGSLLPLLRYWRMRRNAIFFN